MRRASKGKSETADLKDDIQDLVRAIVIKRDGGCILGNIYGVPACSGYRNDGELILQADHLITRANSATYADPRLIGLEVAPRQNIPLSFEASIGCPWVVVAGSFNRNCRCLLFGVPESCQ